MTNTQYAGTFKDLCRSGVTHNILKVAWGIPPLNVDLLCKSTMQLVRVTLGNQVGNPRNLFSLEKQRSGMNLSICKKASPLEHIS